MEALERRLASAEASATGVSVVGTNNSSLVGAPTTGSGGGGNGGGGNNSHLHHHRSHHSGRSRSATTSEAEEDEEDEEEEEEDVGMDSTEENDLDLKPLRPPRTADRRRRRPAGPESPIPEPSTEEEDTTDRK